MSSKTTRIFRPTIFSGIQPTGIPHLGNYYGAITNWVAMTKNASADDQNLLFSVVDLHALTVPQSPVLLRKSILDTAISLLAAGIDPKRCTLFVQSHVRKITHSRENDPHVTSSF